MEICAYSGRRKIFDFRPCRSFVRRLFFFSLSPQSKTRFDNVFLKIRTWYPTEKANSSPLQHLNLLPLPLFKYYNILYPLLKQTYIMCESVYLCVCVCVCTSYCWNFPRNSVRIVIYYIYIYVREQCRNVPRI